MHLVRLQCRRTAVQPDRDTALGGKLVSWLHLRNSQPATAPLGSPLCSYCQHAFGAEAPTDDAYGLSVELNEANSLTRTLPPNRGYACTATRTIWWQRRVAWASGHSAWRPREKTVGGTGSATQDASEGEQACVGRMKEWLQRFARAPNWRAGSQ